MSSLRRLRRLARLANLANRRSNRRSNRLASPRALGATPIRQDLPHHPARAHTNHQRARTLSTPSSARQAWRASAVPRLRRPRWSDRLVARAPARAGASAPRPRSARARPWAASSSRRLAANPPRGAPGGGVHARGDRGRPRRLRVRRRQEERLLAGGRVQAARVGGAQPRPALPSHLRRPAHAHPRVPVPRPGGRARRAVVPARVRRRRNADRPILLPRLEAVHGGASPPHPVAAPLPDRASRNRANPRPLSIPPLEDANAKPRSIDRSIDRASRRLRSRRLGVFHCPTDLPAAAPASRPATRATHRRPLFVPRPLPSPRSPPRR